MNRSTIFKSVLLVIILCAVAFVAQDIAYAQDDIPKGAGFVAPPTEDLPEEISESNIRNLTVRVVSYFLGFLGLVSMVVLIYGGMLMIFSGGSDDNVTKGRNIVLYAGIGIILCLSAFTLTNFFIQAVGGPDDGGTPVPQGGYIAPNGEWVPYGPEYGEGFRPYAPYYDTGDGGTIESSSDGALEREIAALRTDIERLLSEFDDLKNVLSLLDNVLLAKVKDILIAIDVREPRAFEVAIGKILALDDPLNTDDDDDLAFIANFLKEMEILRDRIVDFFGRLPPTDENTRGLNEQLDLLQELLRDPGRYELLEELIDIFEDFQKKIEDSRVMIAHIKATPFRGSAPLTVVLDATESSDPTNTTIPSDNYHWWYLDTNGNRVNLERQPITTATFDEPGKYVINLRVETAMLENGIKAAIDGYTFAEITVEPPAATVSFTLNGQDVYDVYSATLAESQAGIAFDPSASRSELGRTFTSYLWDFGDGSAKEERTTPIVMNHFYPDEGNYRVSLTITDDAGNRVTRSITLQVKAIAAKMNITPKEGNSQTLFTFDASRSISMNGDIIEYSWNIIKQGEPVGTFTEPSFSQQFEQPGTYQISLMVRDSQGGQDNIVRLLDVTSQTPVAYFNWEQIRESTPSTIVFDTKGSFDPDVNDRLVFDWDFDGDGTIDVVATDATETIYKFAAPGTYLTRLIARDEHGTEGYFEKEVTVTSILDLDLEVSPVAAPLETEITFRANSPRATSYYWSFGDQTSHQSDQPITSHVYTQAGIYDVTVSAFDAEDNETIIRDKVYIGEKGKPLAIMEVNLDNRELKAEEGLCGPGRPGIIVNRKDLYTFDGRLSLNKDGSHRGLTYEWDFGDGTRGTDKKMLHSFDELSKKRCHVVQLTVFDRASGVRNVSPPLYIKVVNEKPSFVQFMVSPPANQDLITPTPVTAEIVGPFDLDGHVAGYKFWYYYKDSREQFGTQTTNKPRAILTVTARGLEDAENEVFFGAQMVDNDGAKVSHLDLGLPEMALRIKNGRNLPPEVTIKPDRTNINAGDAVSFFAEANDPQGFPIPQNGYKWDFDGDGVYDDTTSGAHVARVYDIPGEYEVRLKVTSKGGLPTTETIKIFVERLSKYPKAAFLFDVRELEVGFDASNSQFDPAIPNNSLQYAWDFDLSYDSNGDGDPQNDIDGTSRIISNVYPTKKNYKVKLTITDVMQTKQELVREVNLVTPLVAPEEKTSPIIESTSHGITTLDVSIENSFVSVGDTTEVIAKVKNADGTPYNGRVNFTVLEGSAIIEPDSVAATQSRAGSLLQVLGAGTIEIQVRAEGTSHGTIEETVVLIVI